MYETPLHVACKHGSTALHLAIDVNMSLMLIDRVADVNARNEYRRTEQIAIALIEGGANGNTAEKIDNMTLLHLAYLRIVIALIDYEADVRALDKYHSEPSVYGGCANKYTYVQCDRLRKYNIIVRIR